jgi:hypothetical protein
LLDTTIAVVAAARLISLRRGITARAFRSSSSPLALSELARVRTGRVADLPRDLFAPGAAVGATVTDAMRPMQCMTAVGYVLTRPGRGAV